MGCRCFTSIIFPGQRWFWKEAETCGRKHRELLAWSTWVLYLLPASRGIVVRVARHPCITQMFLDFSSSIAYPFVLWMTIHCLSVSRTDGQSIDCGVCVYVWVIFIFETLSFLSLRISYWQQHACTHWQCVGYAHVCSHDGVTYGHLLDIYGRLRSCFREKALPSRAESKALHVPVNEIHRSCASVRFFVTRWKPPTD